MKIISSISLLLLLIITTSCSTQPNAKKAYQQAITNAALHQLKPNPLLTIPPSKPYLTMVTWTSKSYTLGNHHLHHKIWVTAKDDLKQTCQSFPKNRTAPFIEQLLGMPPQSDYSNWHLTIMLVPNHQAHLKKNNHKFSPGLFRPCLSTNSIRTPTCSYQLKKGTADYNHWLLQLTLKQYRNKHGYPWTGLGYTYNWNPNTQSSIGLSEFVITPNTPITIINSQSPAAFCYNT